MGRQGDEAFGLYTGIALVSSFNGLANFGINQALVKFLGEQGRSEKSDTDIWAGLAITGGLGLLLALVLTFIKPLYFSAFLNIPISEVSSAQSTLYYCLVWANLFMISTQVFAAVIDAAHRNYLSNSGLFFYHLLLTTGSLSILYSSGDFAALGYVQLSGAISYWLLMAFLMKRAWGAWPSTTGLGKDLKESIKKQISFSKHIFMGWAVNYGYEPLLKILVTRYFGLAALGYFEIALRIRGQLWGVFHKILYPLIPTISAEEDITKAARWVRFIQTRLFFLLIPFSIALVPASKLIYMLLKGMPEKAHEIGLAFACSAYLFTSVTIIPLYYLLIIKVDAKLAFRSQLVNTLTSLSLFFISLNFIETFAAYLAIASGTIASFAYLFYQADHRLPKGFRAEKGWHLYWMFGLLFSLTFANLMMTWQLTPYVSVPLSFGISMLAIYAIFRTTGLVNSHNLKAITDKWPKLQPLVNQLFP